MRIAIVNLTGGGISGGYRKYITNVIPLIATNPCVQAILCASPIALDVQTWLGHYTKIEYVQCKAFKFLSLTNDSELYWSLEKFSPDIVFVPVERTFKFANVPVVNMVQNMEPFSTNINGNPINEKFRRWIQGLDGKRAIRRADRVIALSKYVSEFLVEHCGISNEHIGLVYHGIDFEKDEVGRKPDIIPENWKDNFIFTAGSIRPARGLEDLLSAMNHLNSHESNRVKLVIAGESGHRMARFQKRLSDWIQTHDLSSDICWAGDLNENEMMWCYQNCSAFVMTSRVESFGMIGGEAMSYGCICISADNPCLPELFGDAAIYYTPYDGEGLAGVLKRALILDDNQRKAMSEKAKERAVQFSWDVCAERTVAELAKAANK